MWRHKGKTRGESLTMEDERGREEEEARTLRMQLVYFINWRLTAFHIHLCSPFPDLLTAFNLTNSSDNDDPASRNKPDDGDDFNLLLSEPETEYLDFSNVSAVMRTADQSLLDEEIFKLPDDSVEMSELNEEVFMVKRKMFNVRIRTKIAPDCQVSGQTMQNGIKICISPRKKKVQESVPSEGKRLEILTVFLKIFSTETVFFQNYQPYVARRRD